MNTKSTNAELYLAKLAGEDVQLPNPITNEEFYMARAAGMPVTPPAPYTNKELYWAAIVKRIESGGTGGGGTTIRNQDKTVTANGQYRADSGYTGLGTVTVNVPQEEPVVEPLEVTENGTYNPPDGVDGYGPVTVNVEVAGGGTEDIVKSILDKTITEFTDSKITYIGESAFCKCKSLTKLDLPNLTTLEALVFSDCTSLVDVNVPSLKTANNGGQFKKAAISEISLPSLVKINSSMFQSCSNLKRVYAPVAVEIQAYAFEYCTALEEFDAPNVLYQLLVSCFKGSSLKKLVLRQTTKTVTLQNVSVFNDTPFASGGTGGVLLIPSALVTAYTEATNWSVIYGYGTNRFLALEDYTVDGTTTGEIDWDKVNALFEEASA